MARLFLNKIDIIHTMTPLIRYTLLQIPGWLLLGCLLWLAVTKDWIVFSTAAWIMAAWLLKDALLYPMCKRAFMQEPATETEKLIGREAETITRLSPQGLIRLDGEQWSARAHNGDLLDAGLRVRVIRADGLVLFVESFAARDNAESDSNSA